MTRPPPAQPAQRRVPVSTRLAVASVKALWVAVVVAIPVLGVWVASSLAAYQNGPIGVAVAAGLLLFPGLPLAWEAWSTRRRARKGLTGKPRFLTFGDRFILRTLVLNLLFLGPLLAKSPTTAFSALSTRGDWMLDGRRGQTPDAVRRGLFLVADRLEWIYTAAHDNPYRRIDEPTPSPSADASTRADVPVPVPTPDPEPARPSRKSEWPAVGELHHTVTEIPASSETSIQAVARYITDRESDPFLRVKALHDYVADRVAYDGVALQPGKRPPQDAQTVFTTHKGVCEGYSRLFTALANAAGVDAPYVGGDARTKGQREHGEPHAWNAVRIGGRFYLVDVTWDSGGLDDGITFTKHYRTDYLFTPPEVFALGHYPDEARWQLRDAPISRGDFMRQASLDPRFFAQGRRLMAPTRSQVSVEGSIDVRLGNPEGFATLADFVVPEERLTATGSTPCRVQSGAETVVHCDFPRAGSWLVRLFGNREGAGSYAYLGQIEANSVR